MINFNGTLMASDGHIFGKENRAFKYGDGLFETLKVVSSRIHFMEDHYFRLMASMRMLRMEIPMTFTQEFLEEEILKTVRKNEIAGSARVRLTVYRNDGGLYAPTTNSISYLVETGELPKKQNSSYQVDLFKDYYVYAGLLSTVKTTNKIINVLAGVYCVENQMDNCLLLNEHKNVVEAINGNIFLVKGTHIRTPGINQGCIKGIIRKKVIDLVSRSTEFSIEEGAISPFDIQKADELFVTNAIIGIQAVTQYRKVIFKTTVSNQIASELEKLVR